MAARTVSPDVAILRALFQNTGGHVTGVKLAEELGCTRSAIWKRIENLQTLGYEIEAQPHLGYRLISAPDILVSDELQARLPEHPFTRKLVVFRETKSTNDLLLREAQSGAEEGFCIVAESQSGGRGRLGRSWESPPGQGLWFSLLFRPAWPISDTQRLTLITSVALSNAIERLTTLPCQIKWPNDIFLHGRKLAGILTEAQGDMDRLHYAVVGIGLNVHQSEKDFSPALRKTATSIRTEAGQAPRRADLLIAIFQELKRLYDAPFDEVREQWRDRCLTLGKNIRVQSGNETYEGQMMDVDASGALQIRLPSGRTQTLNSGELQYSAPA